MFSLYDALVFRHPLHKKAMGCLAANFPVTGKGLFELPEPCPVRASRARNPQLWMGRRQSILVVGEQLLIEFLAGP